MSIDWLAGFKEEYKVKQREYNQELCVEREVVEEMLTKVGER